MEHVSKEEKGEILDFFGKLVILNVRDNALKISMDIVQQKTINPVKMKEERLTYQKLVKRWEVKLPVLKKADGFKSFLKSAVLYYETHPAFP